jgi:hypothetical protein
MNRQCIELQQYMDLELYKNTNRSPALGAISFVYAQPTVITNQTL